MFSSIRIAIRSLARRPAVAAVAIVSLTIGMGVNSAVFSIVDAVYFKPPAVTSPESLVEIMSRYRDSGYGSLDLPDIQEIGRQTSAFSGVAASMPRGGMWRNGDETTLLLVDAVSDNYFNLLGVRPVLGRIPEPSRDFAADSEPPILLAHWFWKEHMGGRSDVIGERMEFRDHVWRIAAVLPPGFRGLNPLGQRHVWIPMSGWLRYWRGDGERGGGQFEAIAKLQPGSTVKAVQAQLDVLATRLEREDARIPKGRQIIGLSVAEQMRDRLRPGMIIMAAVWLVLLVSCANVAAVLLVYAESRKREIGMRLSLGASRIALLRQFVVEGLLLVTAGTAAGLVLATWLLSLIAALAPPSEIPLNYPFAIDMRMLLFTAACAITTLIVFSIAPLSYSIRVPLLEAISGSRSTGRGPRSLFRFALVASQIAFTLVLVSGAVVLTRSLFDAEKIYPGFDPSRPLALVWMSVNGRDDGRSDDQRFREAAQQVALFPAVEAVTYARHLPLVGSGAGARVSVQPEGAAADAPPRRIYFNLVGPDFFAVTGAQMVRGRAFAPADFGDSSPSAAILNSEAAKRFWPGRDPLGKLLTISGVTYRVVGITADGRIGSLHETPSPGVWLPGSRMKSGETILIARTKGDPAPLVKSLGQAAGKTPGLRVYQTGTLRTLMKEALYSDWVPMLLGTFLGTIGLVLAAGGLYGAISFTTERRLGEFGVRLAVGAQRRQIATLVVRQGVLLCLAGVPVGVGIFVAAYRLLSATLFNSKPIDAYAIATGTAITVLIVLAGAVVPAMRAARVDLLTVLRAE